FEVVGQGAHRRILARRLSSVARPCHHVPDMERTYRYWFFYFGPGPA
ncbi:MAG: hypothetical protein QOI81_163, partial [Actinomycetota bacterium]|nr:hypothetical protein [Actinomycetota bacterium]